MNPGQCCGFNTLDAHDLYRTVGYYGVQREWTISYYGFYGNKCTSLERSIIAKDTNFVCIGNTGRNTYTGSKYQFGEHSTPTRKREVEDEDCQTPDGLVLQSGTRYNI